MSEDLANFTVPTISPKRSVELANFIVNEEGMRKIVQGLSDGENEGRFLFLLELSDGVLEGVMREEFC